jgi:N-methylhydantoinase A
MELDRDAAVGVMQPLADELGLSIEDAAYSVYTTSNNVMAGLIEDMTVKEGINPRDSYLVVGGGATAAHICEIAGELGIGRIMIPHFAAGLSAFGGLISDIRWEAQATAITSNDHFTPDRVNEALRRMRKEGERFLERARIPKALRRYEYAFLARYRYQSWEIEVPFAVEGGEVGPDDVAAFSAAFHAMHERIYSIKMETDVIEFTTWKLRAVGVKEHRPPLAGVPEAAPQAPRPHARRPVYFRELGGMVDCPIFRGEELPAGSRIVGPAVVEERTTTIYLPSRVTAVTDLSRNYHASLGS